MIQKFDSSVCNLNRNCYNVKIPFLCNLHVYLHDHIAWYRHWHHHSKRPHVHWGVLIIVLILASALVYSNLVTKPSEVKADTFSVGPSATNLVVLDTTVPDAWDNSVAFTPDIVKKSGSGTFFQGDALNSFTALGSVTGVGYKEDGTSGFQGTEAVVRDLDKDGVFTSAADTLVDADGSASTGVSGPTGLTNGDALKAMGNDIAGGSPAVALCTNSLTAPTAVRIDTDGDCTNGNKRQGTYLLNPIPIVNEGDKTQAAIEVTNAWSFRDDGATANFYDDGEDIFINKGSAAAPTYSTAVDDDVYGTGGLTNGDTLTDFTADCDGGGAGTKACKFTGSAPIDSADSILVDEGTRGGTAPNSIVDKQADRLTGIVVRNLGTAVNITDPSHDISAVKLWADDGDDVFESNEDTLLSASMTILSNKKWREVGLLQAIPAGGQRIYVTVDLTATPNDGRTLNFQVDPYSDANSSKTPDESGDAGFFVSSNNQEPTSNVTSGDTFTIDTVEPTVAISSTVSDSTNISPIPMTATFDEAVTGFTSGDISPTNGLVTSFTPASGLVYDFEITPTGQGEVTASISSGVAEDAAGNGNADSNVFSIIFDSVSPIVENITSTNGDATYGTGNIISIQISFSEAVVVTGTPLLHLETGDPDQNASFTDGSGTDTLSFEYTVVSGDASPDLDYIGTDSLDLNSGTIKDEALNDADLTLFDPGDPGSLGFNKNIVIDTEAEDETPPSLLSFDSDTDDGAYGPGSNINIKANYSEVLDENSTLDVTLDNDVSVTLDSVDGSAISGTYNVGGLGSGEDSPDLTVNSISNESVFDLNENEQTDSEVPEGSNLGDNADIVIDTSAPNDPIVVASTSHTVSVPSKITIIDIEWFPPATDNGPAGVDGYAYVFNTTSDSACDEIKNLEETETSVSSEELEDGSYYFHICTVDNASNWTSTVNVGPFVIDNVSPVPGNEGQITTSSVFQTSLTLNWTKATDNASDESGISYEVRQSSSDNISTVGDAQENGDIIMAYDAAIYAFEVTGLSASTTYFFNVIAKDEAGNKVIYETKEETTTAPEEEPPPPAACSDGIDNDGDGLIDFPADPGCTSGADTNESNPPAGGAVFLPILLQQQQQVKQLPAIPTAPTIPSQITTSVLTAPLYTYVFPETLSFGKTNNPEFVRFVQTTLSLLYPRAFPKSAITGTFDGNYTIRNICRFQAEHGLIKRTDYRCGYTVGERTRAALFQALQSLFR